MYRLKKIFYNQKLNKSMKKESKNNVSRLKKIANLIKKSELNIQQGDFVDFGPYGNAYVNNPDYSEKFYWITDLEEDRDDAGAAGWSIEKSKAVSIIEQYNY